MVMVTQTSLELASANVRLPWGRVQAEEIINEEYPRILRPLVLKIPVDSRRTLADLLDSGEISLRTVDALSRSTSRIPPSLSTDMSSMSVFYTINLNAINTELTRHSRPGPVRQPLVPIKAASYTGIIIIANGELPVHGRNTSSLVQPCIFPKIWDSDMNLIYSYSMTTPSPANIVRYVDESAIFRNTPSGMESELEALVGKNPLRIFARGVFGMRPTDPIIDKEEALSIISSQDNIRLLREARVAIVLDSGILKQQL
jgi:hypothetical protein